MSKLKYQNQFTLPNGRRYFLNMLTNKDYKVIVQYGESNNKEGLVNAVFSLIRESIEDFDDFDIIEKLYVSLVYCFYNIKTSIDVVHDKFGSQTIPLETIISNLESVSKGEPLRVFVGAVEIEATIPKKISISDNNFEIDYSSAITSIKKDGKKLSLSNTQRELFVKKMGIRLAGLEEEIRKRTLVVDIFKGVPMASYKINLMEASCYNLIFDIYKDSLRNFYELLYTMVEYLKMSYADFIELTPIEVNILINRFVEDKEEQKKRAERKTPLG